MENLNFDTPVWVRYYGGAYHVRSLMAGTEVFSNPKLERAITSFREAVRKEFYHVVVEEENLSQLLWYSFNPEIQSEVLELHFEYGRRSFNGAVLVFWFPQKGYTVVGIPALGPELFIPPQPRPKRKELINEVITRIQEHARKFKRETGSTLDLNEVLVQVKSEYLTTVGLNLAVKNPKLELAQDGQDFFQQMYQQQMNFNGGYELGKVGTPLNQLYPDELTRAYYREELVKQVGQLLFGGDKVPVVLIGPRRGGKTAILHEVLRRYLKGEEDKEPGKQIQVWEVDPTRIISGMSIVGMWQRRMEAIIRHLLSPVQQHSSRQDKLYFSNVVALFRIGKTGQNDMTLSDVLKPYLQERKLQVILEATPGEWDVASEMDRSFTDLFKVIRIHEPSDELAYRTIGKLRVRAETVSRLRITVPALWRLIELQRRFYRSEALVGRVADSLHQLATKFAGKEVDGETVLQEFSAQTHLHPRFANRDILPEKDEYHEHFSSRLIGQPEAVNCLVKVLHAIKAQLNDPERPFGSFLFIGPTGVGKTQAAKELANYLFTHEEGLVRFDMNEYIAGDAVQRLVGDFHQPEGLLTSKIRYNPYCVLLFDEIEKAHPDVHNLLLQVLGEGRLTDSLGRTVSFRNTVIIMTSNLGAERVGREINPMGREEVAASTYRKAVMDFFRPEFINRIDEIVIFKRLQAEHIARIAWLQINGLLRRHGFVRRNTILRVSPEALEQLALRGFDPNLGGRALKRQIEKEMTALLAEQMVTIKPDFPVIFDLKLEGSDILPRLISLNPVQSEPMTVWPHFEGLKVHKEEVERLLDRLMDIKADLLDVEEEINESVDILKALEQNEGLEAGFSLKDQVYQLEEELQQILWDYSVRRKRYYDAPLFHFRSLLPLPGSDGQQQEFEQLAGGGRVQERLQELFQQGTPLVPESNARFFDLASRVSWLDYFVSEYYEKGLDRLLVYIGALTVPSGIKYHEASYIMDYLVNLYVWLSPFSEIYLYSPEQHVKVLYFKGPGLHQLFRQEEGIHLASVSPNPMVPVEVKLMALEKEQNVGEALKQMVEKEQQEPLTDRDSSLPVVRLYSFEELKKTGRNNRAPGYFLDFRRGLVHHTDLSTEDFQLLFFANIPDTYKFQIDEHD